MRTPALRTASCPSPITHHGGIMGQVRRVVTGHDNNGKAIVISDGPAPIHTNPLRPGQISHEIWKTKESPIPIDRNEADPVAGPRKIHPPAKGTMFRISEVPPETDAIRN